MLLSVPASVLILSKLESRVTLKGKDQHSLRMLVISATLQGDKRLPVFLFIWKIKRDKDLHLLVHSLNVCLSWDEDMPQSEA